ncbi:hypothetical protein GYMLUDRAFT_160525 [Collybiopsis luxurians FD-317 M1]|nr:hypothetical protein GYMLUDRAFT_160525 [Collybiopsis luxurians FD-317 M1]
MNYPNYCTDIVAKHGVEIRGWPTGVEFKSPHEIKDSNSLNTLYDAWTSGAAYWAVMSKTERKAHLRKLEQDEAAGVQVKVPRKTHSDAGGTHNSRKRKSATTPTQEPPSK